jgi:hypothetical protein
MKTLLIIAGVFFSVCGAFVAYFASADPGHEYDLKLVLPVDTRQMPRPVVLPVVEADSQAVPNVVEGRAESQPIAGVPDAPIAQNGDRPAWFSQPRQQ